MIASHLASLKHFDETFKKSLFGNSKVLVLFSFLQIDMQQDNLDWMPCSLCFTDKIALQTSPLVHRSVISFTICYSCQQQQLQVQGTLCFMEGTSLKLVCPITFILGYERKHDSVCGEWSVCKLVQILPVRVELIYWCLSNLPAGY